MDVGVIGIQGYGGTYFKTIAGREGPGGDRVVGVCDLDAGRVGAVADQWGVRGRYTDYREMLADGGVGAVFIATPHFLHHPMGMAALRAGKHVFCEKPLAITAVHAEEMVRAARERGLVLSCHYNQRTRPYVRALRGAVREGILGVPYAVNVRWMARWTGFMFDARTDWRLQKAKSGGGILIGRGSHLIDAVLYVLGHPRVEWVSASVHGRLTGGEVDDLATATLGLAGGVTVHLQCSYVAHTPDMTERLEFEVYGDGGGAVYRSGGEVQVGRAARSDGTWTDLTGQLPAESLQPGGTVVDDFLDAIRDGREPLVTGEQAAEVTRVVEAGYRSAETGEVVRLL